MNIIVVIECTLLVVEDTCNPSNQDALKYVNEIINEAFGREIMKEYPRVRLILMESRYAK